MTVELGSAYGKIEINADGVQSGVNKANAALGQLKGVAAGVGLAITAAFVTAAAAIGTAVVGVVTSSVGMAADLEEQMDVIASVMGAAGDEIQKLEDLILQLGLNPNLKVSTLEAAEAIEMLGRNGLTTAQILEGAAEATVLLANATGAEFGTAANIATDAMAIFNIDAANMLDAVDGITSVVQNSKFTIEDYALALAQGGGVAATVGLNFEDFNTTIAAISPLFASGSDAGTSLKTMLLRLAPSTDKAKDAMSELGIITEESGNRFFDAEGNLKSMSEIAGIMEEAFTGLSDEQRNQALATIFGTDAMRAAAGIFNTGKEGFEELMEAMGKTDAMEAAATRMGNFKGQMEIAGGIVEALKIQIGSAFLPILTELAKKVGEFLDQNGDRFVAFFEGAATFIDTFVTALMNGEGPIDGFLDALASIGVPQETIDTIQNVVDTIGRLVDKVVLFVDEHSEAFKGALLGIGAALVAGGVLAAIGALAGLIASLASPVVLIMGLVALLGAAWAENWGGIRDKVGVIVDQIKEKIDFEQVFADIQTALENIKKFFGEVFGEIERSIEGGLTPLETVGEILDNFIPEATMTRVWDFLKGLQGFGRYMREVVESGDPLNDFLAELPESLQPLAKLFGEAGEAVKEAFDGLAPFVEEQGGKITAWFEENEPLIRDFLGVLGKVAAVLAGVWAAGWAIAVRVIANFGKVIKPILGGALDLILGLAKTVMQMATGDWEGAWETVKETAENVWEAIKETFAEFVDWVAGWFDSSGQEIVDTFKNNWEQLKEIAEKVVENIKESIKSKIEDFIETWRKNWAKLKLVVVNALMAVKQSISNKIAEIRTAIATKVVEIIEGWRTKWETMKEVVSAAWETIKQQIGDKIESIRASIVERFEAVKASVAETWDNIKAAILQKIVELFEAMGLDFDEMKARWSKIWEDLKTIAGLAWERIVTAVTEKIEEVRAAIQTKLDEIKGTWDLIWETIRLAVVTKWNEMVTAVSTKIEEMRAAIQTKLDEIKGTWDLIWETIRLFVVTKWEEMVTAVSTKIEEMRMAISEKVEEIKTAWGEKWDEIRTKVEEIWTTIVTAVSEKIEEVRAALFTKTDEAKAEVSTKWDEIKVKIDEVLGGILTAVSEKMLEVVAKISENMQAGIDAITGFIENFKTVGRNIVQGLIDGILEMAGSLIDTLTGLAEDAIAAAMGALSEGSPSQEFVKIGRWAVEGWIIGVQDMMGGLTTTMYQTGAAVSSSFAEGILATRESVAAAAASVSHAAHMAHGGALLPALLASSAVPVASFGYRPTQGTGGPAGSALPESSPQSAGRSPSYGDTTNFYLNLYTDSVTAADMISSYGLMKSTIGA